MLVRPDLSVEAEIDALGPARKKRGSPGRDKRIVRLWDTGCTQREIAAALGLRPQCVGAVLRRQGCRRLDGKRRGSLSAQFEAFVHPEPNSGCWLWSGSLSWQDYPQLRVAVGELRPASHVALELDGRPVPAGMCACHRCDNPGCVNPDHLFVGTHADNTADMVAKGRHSFPPTMRGSENPSSKLTEEKVKEIRAAFAAGMSLREACRVFGLSSPAYASSIRRRRIWTHV